MSRFTVAAVQMISTPEVEENLRSARQLLQRAKEEGAELALLPEYFALMGRHDTDKVLLREEYRQGPMQHFLSTAARELQLWLIGGTVPLKCTDAGRVRNSCLVFNPNGEQVARYDKIHLFGFSRGDEHYHEARTIEPGDKSVAFDAPFGRVGLSVCYDLRFPELYRGLGELTLLVVPAAFTATTGPAHWEILLRARAIENQCYVLAAAQGGLHLNQRRTHGDSMLIDPWGVIVNRLASGPGVVIGDIDLDRLREVRSQLPALNHRAL